MYNFAEDERVQYDGEDEGRLMAVTAMFTTDAMDLITQMGAYRDELNAPLDEDAHLRMKEVRQALVASLACAQEAIDKLGYVIRVDDEELTRRVSKVGSREDLDTSGL
jgi:hypothetical protein